MSDQEAAYGATIIEALAILRGLDGVDDAGSLKRGIRSAIQVLENPSVPSAWDSRVRIAQGHPLTLRKIARHWSVVNGDIFIVCEVREDNEKATLPLLVLTQQQLSDLIFAAISYLPVQHKDGFLRAITAFAVHQAEVLAKGLVSSLNSFVENLGTVAGIHLQMDPKVSLSEDYTRSLTEATEHTMEMLLNSMRAKILPYAHERHKVVLLHTKLVANEPKEILEQASVAVAAHMAGMKEKGKPRSNTKKSRSKMKK